MLLYHHYLLTYDTTFVFYHTATLFSQQPAGITLVYFNRPFPFHTQKSTLSLICSCFTVTPGGLTWLKDINAASMFLSFDVCTGKSTLITVIFGGLVWSGACTQDTSFFITILLF